MKIYMKVSNDKYELPEAIADSPKELGEILGRSRRSINAAISHKEKTVVRVEVEDYDDT